MKDNLICHRIFETGEAITNKNAKRPLSTFALNDVKRPIVIHMAARAHRF